MVLNWAMRFDVCGIFSPFRAAQVSMYPKGKQPSGAHLVVAAVLGNPWTPDSPRASGFASGRFSVQSWKERPNLDLPGKLNAILMRIKTRGRVRAWLHDRGVTFVVALIEEFPRVKAAWAHFI